MRLLRTKKYQMKRTLSNGKKKIAKVFKIVKDTIIGVINDNVTTLSASLAYATLFSIIPFLSLIVTIGVYLHIDLANQLYTQLQSVVDPKVLEAFRAIINNAQRADLASSAAIFSLAISIFGATTVFAEMQGSLNTIWGIKAVPKKSWLKYIRNRLLSFSIILVFAFILLVTFSVTNVIIELSQRFMTNYPEVAESLVKVVGIILNIAITAFIFTLIFKILPDAKIKMKDVFIGSVVTTGLLLVGQWGISLYIGIANVGTVYGAAAFMVVFITWIYYSAIIIYTGAEFTKAWANEMGGKIFPDEYAVATKVVEIEEDKPQESSN